MIALDRYQLVSPGSMQDALDDLARHPGARPFAGGTDLMVMLEAGQLPPGRYVSLQRWPELVRITPTDAGVAIGALTTYSEIQESPRLEREYPLLAVAARETGGRATQNRGTIGGNIANASPAADTPPVLLVYDAELEIVSAAGTRRVAYERFHKGYKQMDLAAGEIIARIHLPSRTAWLPPGGKDYYRKVGTRRAQAISKVCVAGALRVEGGIARPEPDRRVQDVRIALGSVAPTVVRAFATEASLRGRLLDADTVAEAERTLLSEIAPIDDIRSTARYRARVAGNLLREFLQM
jgi:CO/xanthine dehydrogenase FAD-binding subunit